MGGIEEILKEISKAEQKRREIIAAAEKSKNKTIKSAETKAQKTLVKAKKSALIAGEAMCSKARRMAKKEARKILINSARKTVEEKKRIKSFKKKALNDVITAVFGDLN